MYTCDYYATGVCVCNLFGEIWELKRESLFVLSVSRPGFCLDVYKERLVKRWWLLSSLFPLPTTKKFHILKEFHLNFIFNKEINVVI